MSGGDVHKVWRRHVNFIWSYKCVGGRNEEQRGPVGTRRVGSSRTERICVIKKR